MSETILRAAIFCMGLGLGILVTALALRGYVDRIRREALALAGTLDQAASLMSDQAREYAALATKQGQAIDAMAAERDAALAALEKCRARQRMTVVR